MEKVRFLALHFLVCRFSDAETERRRPSQPRRLSEIVSLLAAITEPSAVAPDATGDYGNRMVKRRKIAVDSSIRRYRARFCIDCEGFQIDQVLE